MPAGVGYELGAQGFGAGLAEALAKIGQSVRASRDEARAKEISGGLLSKAEGADKLFTPEFMRSYQEAAGELSGLVGGNEVLQMINSAISVPLATQTALATQKREDDRSFTLNFEVDAQPIRNQISQYTSELGTTDKKIMQEKYDALVKSIGTIAQKYPSEGARSSLNAMLASIPQPTELSSKAEGELGFKKARENYYNKKADAAGALAQYHNRKSSVDINRTGPDQRKVVGDLLNDALNTLNDIQENISMSALFEEVGTINPMKAEALQLSQDIQMYRQILYGLDAPKQDSTGKGIVPPYLNEGKGAPPDASSQSTYQNYLLRLRGAGTDTSGGR